MFESPVDELIARTRIEETLHRFCRGIDRKDWAMLLSAFHHDATDDHGIVKGLAHEVLVPTLRARHAKVTHSAHYLSNVAIEFVTPTTASVESYVRVEQRQDSDDGATVSRTTASVRYVDRFERRDSDWLIAARILVWGDLTTSVASTSFALPDSFVEQRRDDSDPVVLQETALRARPR